MYINKIDDLIDNVIDDFFVNIISKDNTLLKIYKEPNFVKFQKEMNTIMLTFTNSFNLTEIKELVKNNDNIYSISETLKRYIAFYLFLIIGFNYTSNDDTFINNIVEFTKNQSEYGYKINNFFNSESNALIIKYHNMIKNIISLLDADQTKIDILKKKPNYKETILFLNQLGSDYIEKNFKLDKLDGNKQIQSHNIIKTIIVILLYKVVEKKDFFRLLEMTENVDGEYMFIDIVIPKQKYIDFNSVEKLIGSDDTLKNLSHYFWQFLTDHEELIQKPAASIEDKIILLIQSGIIYPICDDFLLYHKDSEKYDKSIDPLVNKKKDDTKIRYIINKIEITSELYSEQTKKDEKIRNNIKKNFYMPLLNRKAIIVNHNEDIHIINKFLNQGKRSMENNEYFNDLMNYNVYPYINFKDFEKDGFSISLHKTIDIVRYVSLTKDGEYKQNKNNNIQLRVGSKDTIINVVGFMIPTNLKPLHCLKLKETTDIRSLSHNKYDLSHNNHNKYDLSKSNNNNGYDLMVKYLRQSVLGTNKHSSSVFWIFDLDKDIINTDITEYNQIDKLSIQDQIKYIISVFYDNIINELYYSILDKLEKKENLTVQMAYMILNLFEKKIINIPIESDILNQLEIKIYELIKKVEPVYDKNEDIVHGISENIIHLPEYDINNKQKIIQTIKINLSDIKEYGKFEEKDNNVEGICQHNVSWERIASMQKTKPKLYVDELYNFIQQYVFENVDQEFICKSCGFQLNIKKYIIDGVFDDDTQKFITYSMPLDVPLEDIQEYEKYKITIRNIDKFIEKVAIVSNIPHLTKSSANVKWRKKTIIKDVIDLLLMNNIKLKNNLKERNELANKLYGINRDLSNLFVFELENSIFVFSSKDKDHYKPIKQNNILTYLIFLILLEVNDSHIPFIGGDKKGLCNFQVFDKIYYSLYDGLKIRINNKGELTNITNYKILCYIIYIISCSCIKYNMWYYEYPDQTKKKKYLPIIQKIFVHTLVDIINSILEIASMPNVHYLYEIISIKMFKKLNSTFSNEELYNYLKNENKILIVGEKKEFISTKKKFIELSGKFNPMIYDLPYRVVCKVPKFIMNKKNIPYLKYYNINNITNCTNGQFHNLTVQNSKIICNLCKIELSNLQLDENETKKILNNFRYIRLQNLTNTFCLIDGLTHQISLNENGKLICTKCGKNENDSYTHEELNKLEKSLEKIKYIQSEKIIEKNKIIHENIKNDISYIEKVINHLSKSYTDSTKTKQFKFIDNLIDELQNIIGNESGTSIYLKENSYIINHDYLGHSLDKNIIITDGNNKIFYKQNHTFFKTNVIYYNNGKKIDIFYDAITKLLLGYKEESKNFIFNIKQDKHLIVNYSIMNKLKILGYSSQFIDITTEYENFLLRLNKKNISKIIIMNIIRNRIYNLKKVIYVFQRILYRIINNYNEPIIPENESEYFSNKLNIFIEKYKKKISNINISNNKGDHMIFKHWKGVDRGLYAIELQEVKYNFDEQKIINVDEITKLDHNGNIILYFIIEELTKLLKYNDNNLVKVSISYFIIDFINIIFELFNDEKILSKLDVKRFGYILSSTTYVQQIMEKYGIKEIEGMYSEYKDSEQQLTPEDKEELIDNEEEQDALDIDYESESEAGYQYEGEFFRSQDWEPNSDIVYNPNI